MQSFDTALFLLCNVTLAAPWLDPFFVFITHSRHWVIPVVAGCLIALIRVQFRPLRIGMRPNWKTMLWAIVIASVTVGICDRLCDAVLKPLFGRPRPCHPDMLVEGGRFLLGYKKSLSMPSIHAANMFAAATVLTLFWRRLWLWYFVPAALVAYSRVYVGVHYPGDILAGAAVGVALAGAVYGTCSAVQRYRGG